MIYTILIQGGVGDLLTYLSRLDSLLQKDDKVKFAIRGGFPKAIEWEKEILSADPRIIEVTTGTIPKADKILDWRADLAPLGYPIQIPFEVQISKAASIVAKNIFSENGLDSEKTVVVHPRTTEGNIRGFESERHWDEKKWVEFIGLCNEGGLRIIRIGVQNDYFPFDGVIDLVGQTNLLESIGLIYEAKYCVDVNSFVWEVSAYAGHPTAVLWFHNHFWIPLHVPENLNNLVIFKEKTVDPKTVFEKLLSLN